MSAELCTLPSANFVLQIANELPRTILQLWSDPDCLQQELLCPWFSRNAACSRKPDHALPAGLVCAFMELIGTDCSITEPPHSFSPPCGFLILSSHSSTCIVIGSENLKGVTLLLLCILLLLYNTIVVWRRKNHHTLVLMSLCVQITLHNCLPCFHSLGYCLVWNIHSHFQVLLLCPFTI